MKIKALSNINHNQYKPGDVFEWPDKLAKRLIELGAAEIPKLWEFKNVKKPEPEKVTSVTPIKPIKLVFNEETQVLGREVIKDGPVIAGEDVYISQMPKTNTKTLMPEVKAPKKEQPRPPKRTRAKRNAKNKK